MLRSFTSEYPCQSHDNVAARVFPKPGSGTVKDCQVALDRDDRGKAIANSALPEGVQAVAYLNPLALIIEQSRAAIFSGQWPDMGPWLVDMAACMLLALCGAGLFRRLRRGFADVV